MSVKAQSAEPVISGDLYQELQHFYAIQMQYLDHGEIDKWVLTFTDDGVFATNTMAPARGRAAIAEGARRAARELDRKGIVQRHWLGMLAVQPGADGTLRTRCYAQVIESPQGCQAALRLSALCEDVLVLRDGGWLVRERRVSRDDIR
jgi:hypothetical protein